MAVMTSLAPITCTTAPSISGLSGHQLSVVRSVTRSALGDFSVQFRHATPFTPMRQHLREVCGALRAVLTSHEVTPATAPTVVCVLAARAERLVDQRRHCATRAFAERLSAEEQELRAIMDVLHHVTG